MNASSSICINRSFCLFSRPISITPALIGVLWLASGVRTANAQDDLTQRVQQLTDAITRVQTQMDDSQRQLNEMRKELNALHQQMSRTAGPAPSDVAESAAAKLSAEVEEIRDRQSMQESQLAVEEQTKVESESKYPVKLSGLILMNGFVNTGMMDSPSTPTLAVSGPSSTGVTVRQTVLGLDARGPHLFGARSHADLRLDFDGSATAGNGYAGGYGLGLLRLRTAHAALEWNRAKASFALDRAIISPYAPDSLTAVAEPALYWSGNLATWNPQFGFQYEVPISGNSGLMAQLGFIDVADAPNTRVFPATNGVTNIPSTAELGRWPGVEGRIALVGSRDEHGVQLGLGGFFASHRTLAETQFNSWAGTLDFRLPLPARMEVSGTAYRGLGLGGLGGGAFKDYVYRVQGPDTYFLTLDDVGGWAQWKQRIGERLEFNEALGIDNVPAGQLRPFAIPDGTIYQNLARNRTATGNVIYSPSAYLLFSLEYRRIASSPVNSPTIEGNAIGIAAGYKF